MGGVMGNEWERGRGRGRELDCTDTDCKSAPAGGVMGMRGSGGEGGRI